VDPDQDCAKLGNRHWRMQEKFESTMKKLVVLWSKAMEEPITT
jgi:hypothetical protein